MKLITIVDIPDEDYYYFLDNGVDKWIIDIDGDIRYLNEDGDAWMHYRSPEDDYVLKPLPEKIPPNELGNMTFTGAGYNLCLDDILKEE